MSTRKACVVAFLLFAVALLAIWTASRRPGRDRNLVPSRPPEPGLTVAPLPRRPTPSGERSYAGPLASQATTLTGTLSSPSGAPVIGAAIEVIVRGSSSHPAWESAGLGIQMPASNARKALTRSHEDGTFDLDGVLDAVIELRIRHPEYLTWVGERDLRSSPGPWRIILEEAKDIAGRVIDGAGMPVAGARVVGLPQWAAASPERVLHLAEINALESGPRLDWIQAESTGTDGHFRLGSLPDVDHSLVVFSRSLARVGVFPHVPAGARQVVLPVDLSGSLRGRIVDSSGAPIAECKVKLVPKPQETADPEGRLEQALLDRLGVDGVVVHTGPDGRFELQGLEQRLYGVSIHAPGYAPRALPPVAPPADLGDLALDASVAIRGKVLGPGGATVPNAVVWAVPEEFAVEVVERPRRRPQNTAAGSTTSDISGRFLLDALPIGELWLRACAPGLAPSQWVEGLRDGGELVLHLGEGPPVEGRILAAKDRSPIAGAVVSIDESWTISADDGSFVLRGLVEDGFEGSLLYVSSFVHHPDFAAGFCPNLRFEAGVPRAVEILLDPLNVLSGVVMNENGEPVDSARVELVAAGGERPLFPSPAHGPAGPARAWTDSGGRFELRWPGKNHGLWISHHGYSRLSVPAIHPSILGANPVRFTLRRGAQLTGRVLDAERRPVAGATVTMIAAAATESPAAGLEISGRRLANKRPGTLRMRTTVTQKDGSFRLGNIEAHDSAPPAQNGVGGSRLEPGPHRRRLSVAKSGYGVTEVDIDPAWESGTPVDLILTKAGRVEGRVTSREGPVEGAQVAAWPRYVMASDENGREALATSTTDSAGQFALDGLPCFAVVIEVQAPGFAALRYEDAAPTPEGTKVQISLQRLPSLRGAVRSELTGAAVTRFRLWAWAEDFEDDTLKAACGSRSKTERLIEDPGGRFELADLCLGAEYKLLIRAQGYAPFDLGVRPLLDQSIALDIVLAEGETLEAVVIDRGTGAPIRDAAICIVPTAGSGIDEPVRFTSGSDGVASVRNLRAGEYMARIEHADYVETKPRSISVEAGGSLVRWALSPGGAVRMRLGLPGDFGLLRATGSPFRAQVRFKRSTALEGGAEADCPTEVVLDLAGLGANPGQLESAADEVLLERESMAPGEYEVYFEDHSANAKAEAAPRVTFLGTVRVDAGSTTDCTFQVPH